MGKRPAVAFLCLAMLFMVSNGSSSIKELIPKIESCGPAFKTWYEPNPVTLGVVGNGSIVIKAAHSMLMGTVEAHLNVWPYHFKVSYCQDGKTDIDPKGCYISKGETRKFAGQMAIDESLASLITKPFLFGNVTMRNEYSEMMLCARLNITVIYN